MDYLGTCETPQGEQHRYNAWLAETETSAIVTLEFYLPVRDDDYARFLVEQSAIESNGHELTCWPSRN